MRIREQGLALLEVVIFLILISLGYIGWMEQKKNVTGVDFSLQLSRTLCFYREALVRYIQEKNPTSAGEVLFSDMGIDDPLGILSENQKYQAKFYVTGKSSGYILLIKKKKSDSVTDDDYQLRTILSASLGIFSVPPYPYTDNIYDGHVDYDNKKITVYNDYYSLSNVDLSGHDADSIMAIVIVPETVTPFQECYYGF
ncbi:hypothetical protein RCM47_24330 [Escherichia coli]|nr:hypothetical protein [Escherichia coli]